MDYLLEETVPAAELKKFESRYMAELDTDGKVAAGTQFEYAWCLVRSKYPADIRKGIALLEDLFQVGLLQPFVQGGAFYLSQDFVMFFHVSCEGLPGQEVATVSANQPGELPKTLSSKPCDR